MQIVKLPVNSYDIQRWNHGIGFKNDSFLISEMYMKDSNEFYHAYTGLFRWKYFEISHVYQGISNTWVILKKKQN